MPSKEHLCSIFHQFIRSSCCIQQCDLETYDFSTKASGTKLLPHGHAAQYIFPLTPHPSSVSALYVPEQGTQGWMYRKADPKMFRGLEPPVPPSDNPFAGTQRQGVEETKNPERQRSPRLTIVQPWTSSQLSPVSPRCASPQHPPWPGHFFSKTSSQTLLSRPQPPRLKSGRTPLGSFSPVLNKKHNRA